MSAALASETAAVQNPALGAALLWRFALSFPEPAQRRPSLQLLFVPLPLLFRQDSLEVISGAGAARGVQKASGLRAFADRLREFKTAKTDLLLSLHDSVADYRELSLEAFSLALAAHLLRVDPDANVIAVPHEDPVKHAPERVRRLLRGADKLGHWCGAVTPYEVATVLHLRF